MKTLHIVSIAIGACLLLSSAGVVLAKGQPGTNAGVNCGTGTATNIPGGSAPGSANGSPFTGGTAGAGGVYANTYNGTGTPFTVNPTQTHATSQYDIACEHAQVP